MKKKIFSKTGQRRAFIERFVEGFFSAFIKSVQVVTLTYYEANIRVHLAIRLIHDRLYHRGKLYKHWSDKPYSSGVHKATVWAFIASFAVFTFLQYIAPQIFNGLTPNKAYAGSNNKTWTSLTDFSAPVDSTGLNIYGVGNAASFKLSNNAANYTGTGADGDLLIDGGTTGGAFAKYTIAGVVHALVDGAYTGPFNSTHPLPLDTSFVKADNKYNFTSVTLRNGAILTHSLGSTNGGVQGIELYSTGTVSIDASSMIDVSGKGNSALGLQSYVSGKPCLAGGSYGGQGGTGYSVAIPMGDSPAGPLPYGTKENVEYFGSRGAAGYSSGSYCINGGGLGGGRIKIVANSLVVNGSIQANGTPGVSSPGGGGSGGGIYLSASNMTINNYVSAAGAGGRDSVGDIGTPGLNGTGGYSAGSPANPGGAPGVGGNGGNAGYPGRLGGPSAGGGGNTYASNRSAVGGGGAGRIAIYYGSINGGSAFVSTDIEETSADITRAGTWTLGAPAASYIASPSTYVAGTSIGYTFTGRNQIYWYGAKTSDGGKADVILTEQGKAPQTTVVDTYVPEICHDVTGNTVCDPVVNYGQQLYSAATLDPNKTYTIQIVQRSDKSGPAAVGYKITFDKFTVWDTNSGGYTNTFTGASPAPGVIGPYAYFSKIIPYVASGSMGTSSYGLRFDNSPSKTKWIDLKFKGNVPAGTTVKFQVRAGATLGVNDVTGTNGFVNPTSYTQLGIWGTTIPPGDYTTNAYTLALDTAMPLTKTFEVIVQLTGGAATASVDSIQLDYDNLDAPTNPRQYKSSDLANAVASAGWINETSIVVKADVPDMTPIPTTAEMLTPQIELVTGASPTFTGNNTAFPSGGIAYTPTAYSYAGAASGINFGTLSGLTAGTIYNWKIRFTDQAGRVGPWSSTNVINIDQTAPTLTSISVNSGVANTNNKLVTITLTGATDANSGLSQMRFSNDGINWPPAWEPYASTKSSWDLTAYPTYTSDGPRTVYAQVSDNAGNISGQKTDSNFAGTNSGTSSTSKRVILNGLTTTPAIQQGGQSGDGMSGPWVQPGIYRNYSGSGDGADVFFKFSLAGVNTIASANLSFTGSGNANGVTVMTVQDYGSLTIDTDASYVAVRTVGSGVLGSNSLDITSDVNTAKASGVIAFIVRGSNNSVGLTLSGITLNIVNASPYMNTGIYTSGGTAATAINSGVANPSYGAFIAQDNCPTGTSVVYQIHGSIDGNMWSGSDWLAVTNGSSLAPLNGKQYLQYQATMTSESPNHLSTPVIAVAGATLLISRANIIYDTTSPVLQSGTLTSPNGGEKWKGGTSQVITWDKTKISDAGSGLKGTAGNQSITLSYSTDGGTGWTQLATNEDNDGTYTWNPIPSLDNNAVKVRILATDNIGNISIPLDSATNFVIDSSAPTGSVSPLNQYYNTSSINVPYTASDDSVSVVQTSDVTSDCWEDVLSFTNGAQNNQTNLIKVTYNMTARDSNSVSLIIYNGQNVIFSLDSSKQLASGNTGWLTGNRVSTSCVSAGGNSNNVLATAEFANSKPLSGVKHSNLYYKKDTGSWTKYIPNPNTLPNATDGDFLYANYGTTIPFNSATTGGDGAYQFKMVATDNAGNVMVVPVGAAAADATTTIDTAKPTTTGAGSGTAGTNGWYTSDVTYTLNRTDALSGVASTQYCVDTTATGGCTPNLTYSAPFIISNPASNNYVHWRSTDNAGNVQDIQNSTVIKIDKLAPTTLGAITSGTTGTNGWYRTDVIFTLTPTDATSGLASTSYCVDTAGSCTPSLAYSAPLSITTESATNHIRWTSTDNAGKVQTVQDSGAFKIDKSAPTGTVVINNGNQATQDINVHLNISLTDTGSAGLATYELSNDNGNTWASAVSIGTDSFVDTSVPLTVPTGEGNKIVKVRVRDAAGNETIISDNIFIDTVIPNNPSAIVAQKSDVDNTPINQLTWYPTTTPYFSWTATDVNPGSGIKGYWVYFGTNASGDPLNTSLPAKERFFLPTNHFFPNLPADGYLEGKYYLRVKSVDNVDLVSSAYSEFIYFYDKTPPSNVSGLAATNDVLNKITVSWNAYSITSQEAPLEKYEIERVKAQYYYDHNLQTESGDWSLGAGYTKYSIYRNDPIFNAHTFDDTTVDIGVRYHYRIRAKDLSNVEMGPWQASGLVYGLTLDNVAPEVPPSAVTVGVCNTANLGNCTNAANKGHEIKVTWLGGADAGSGMLGYKIYRHEVGSSADWTVVGYLDVSGPGPYNLVWQDNDTNNTATWAGFKDVTSANVNDHTSYEYRVTGLDTAATPNETALILDNPMTNWNAAEERTPDVTAPPKPTGLTAAALGLDDSDTNDDTIGHQWIRVRWIQTADTNLYGGNGSGINTIRLLRANASGGPYVDVTDDTTYPVTCSLVNWDCTQKRLPDITTYYYKVKVIDAVGLSSGDSDGSASIKTALSTAPTPPQNVVVSHDNGNPSVDGSTLGKKLHISFTGSYAKGCLNNISCVVAYEAYRSTTNLTTPEEWLNPTLATRLSDVTVNFARDERGFPRTFDDASVVDGTRYYYKLRARDNTPSDITTNTVGPFYSTFSEIDETSPQGLHKGWDITPYVTKPGITATDADGGIYSNLEVKVRDTHPNSTSLRNIISWRPVDMPLRRKLAYETCTGKQAGGIDYCNNFAKYVIYRVELASDGTVKKDGNGSEIIVKLAEVSDQQTNYVIDTLSLLFKDNSYSYYVQVVDRSDTLSYPSPYSATLVNNDVNAANVSIPSYAADSIIPGKTTPKIEGNVTLPPELIGVSSATVVWTTDQPTDGVVGFRRKYKAGNSGELNAGSYQVIGEDTSPTQGSSKPIHTVRLFGLEASTAYDYRVVSKNYLSNAVMKGGNDVPELTTKGFSITILDTKPDDITTVSATIRWTTNMPSNTNVLNFRQTDGTQAGSPAETSLDLSKLSDSQKNCTVTPQLCNHEVSISPLKKNTKYGFGVVSVSLDNYYASSDVKFFTTANSDLKQFTVVPSASNVAERNITSTSAQIVFQTSEETTATLFYGNETGAPDYKESKYKLRSTDSLTSTTHVILIDGLEPGKKYFYVVSVSNGLLTYTSPESSFTAVLKPKVSNFKIAEVKPYSFRITWDTNIETDSLISLGNTTTYGEKRGKPGLVKAHDLLVEQLNDNTEYHFQILAKDETGNEVATQDYSLRTPMDTEGPKISGVKIDVLPMGENDTTSSVIVSWQTDKPATTLVEYDEGVIGGSYNKRSIEDTSLGGSHTVIIKDLQPASSYHYRLVSADKRNNKTVSQDYTFVTPSREKSILQLILKSLEETFAWTRNLNQFFGNIGKRLTGK